MDTSETLSKHVLTQEDRLLGNKIRWGDYKKLELICEVCGKVFSVPPSVVAKGKGKYCSHYCANGKPRSQERQNRHGYIYLKDYNHPNRTKQNLIAEHRFVIEHQLGRFLTKDEIPHHINEDKQDNSLGNLYLCRNRLEHKVAHQLRPDDLHMLTLARWSEWESFKDFNLLKGIQDQLQEMCDFLMPFTLVDFYDYSKNEATEMSEYPTSMEQLWLAFYMFEVHKKKWNGTEWIDA